MSPSNSSDQVSFQGSADEEVSEEAEEEEGSEESVERAEEREVSSEEEIDSEEDEEVEIPPQEESNVRQDKIRKADRLSMKDLYLDFRNSAFADCES